MLNPTIPVPVDALLNLAMLSKAATDTKPQMAEIIKELLKRVVAK